MTRLWAVYGTVEHRAGQVLVLTQFADATRQTADEAVDDVEGIDDESETEAPDDPETRIVHASGLGRTRGAAR
jgi:hypothetical protein